MMRSSTLSSTIPELSRGPECAEKASLALTDQFVTMTRDILPRDRFPLLKSSMVRFCPVLL
jgi:hypothetical protein